MKRILVAVLLATGTLCAIAEVTQERVGELTEFALQQVQATVEADMHIGKVSVKSLQVSGDTLKVDISGNYERNHLSDAMVAQLEDALLAEAKRDGVKHVQLTVGETDIHRFLFDFDKKYIRKHEPFITEDSPTRRYKKGLDGNIMAMWHSHGLVYAPASNSWGWQRPRLFQTVEDLYPMSYVLPFVQPMLENAGAYVWNPRERDTHRFEVIADGDGGKSTGKYVETSGDKEWESAGTGFAYTKAVYKDFDNPFADGTARMVEAVKKGAPSTASWSVEMPEDGNYALYISYKTLPNSVNDATYTVNAAGASRTFKVNQRMAGGVWVYLGTFPLKKGLNENVVTLTNVSKCKNGVVTADAVKVGGGMGNIARSVHADKAPVLSGVPRYMEGSRYFLQWSGFPDSVYTLSKNTADYADDYRSRSEWVNYLAGGSQAIPEQEIGLKVPLDLSFAFHTDAGVTTDDETIGTLSLYRSNDFGQYADGTPRIISRTLADYVCRQLVDDARASFDPHWSNRGLSQQNLYETRVPQVPGMLLEYLSHQNFADMRLGLDPSFIFSSSRAIYKGILKFIAKRDHRDYVVQPLPVNSFAITPYSPKPKTEANEFTLSWKATPDTLEPSAMPSAYIVMERVGEIGNAFNEIALVTEPRYTVAVNDHEIHSYRVIAMNEGGRSFPSETLSLGVASESNGTAMVVNAFTRVSAPDWIDIDGYTSFTDETDHGVPYIEGINYIGTQYNRNRKTSWSDARGGFGNSRANYEGSVIAGNSFDFPAVHGEALLKAGYSFVSASVQAVEAGSVPLTGYSLVDVVAGKQKATPVGNGKDLPSKYRLFTPGLISALEAATADSVGVLLSGSYVASDVFDCEAPDSVAMNFAKTVLGYNWGGSQVSCTGEVKVMSNVKEIANSEVFKFNTTLNRNIYCVESPNAIFAADKQGQSIIRYTENDRPAAIASDRGGYRTIVVGFPLETITCKSARETLIQQFVDYLRK